MILKDSAIVLRMVPFGNTSRVVTWLSPEFGKLTTLVKGSQRDKSPFLGQYDLFYTCEILFYAREQRQLHILKECQPLAMRTALRTDWRACAAASYAADLMNRALPDGPVPSGAYDLLERMLDQLATRTPGPASLLRFELQLLQELGLLPDWDRCGRCHAEVRAAEQCRLDVEQGTLFCASCGDEKGHLLGSGVLETLRAMRDEQELTSLPGTIFRTIQKITGGFLEFHADFPPDSRRIAFEVLGEAQEPVGR